MRTLPDLAGSSLFPSWTEDGRLCFRYDGDDYRGFMMASNVLSLPEQPLPAGGARVPATLRWDGTVSRDAAAGGRDDAGDDLGGMERAQPLRARAPPAREPRRSRRRARTSACSPRSS